MDIARLGFNWKLVKSLKCSGHFVTQPSPPPCEPQYCADGRCTERRISDLHRGNARRPALAPALGRSSRLRGRLPEQDRARCGLQFGILAYEIAKLGPSFIHAIDGSEPELDAARRILRSVETSNRVDLVDLADDERLRAILDPRYDIVQLLAVYQHVQKVRGDKSARRMVATLAEHCRERFIVATQPGYLPAVTETMLASGFALERETQSLARRVKHLVFCCI